MDGLIRSVFVSADGYLKKFRMSLPREFARYTHSRVAVVSAAARQSGPNQISFAERDHDDDLLLRNLPLHWNQSSKFSFWNRRLLSFLKNYHPHLIIWQGYVGSLEYLQILTYRFLYSPETLLVVEMTNPNLSWVNKMMAFPGLLTAKDGLIYFSEPYSRLVKPPGSKLRSIVIHPSANLQVFRPRTLPELRDRFNPESGILIGIFAHHYKPSLLEWLEFALNVDGLKLMIFQDSRYPFNPVMHKVAAMYDSEIIVDYSHEEFAQYLNSLDGFLWGPVVSPTLERDALQTTAEIMASGLPLICSDHPFNRQLFEGGAVFYDPIDPLEVRMKLQILKESPTYRRRLGWQSRQLAELRFSPRENVTRLVEFCQDF